MCFPQNSKTDLHQFFFHGLREKNCFVQPALKSNAIGLCKEQSSKFAGCVLGQGT